MPNYLYFLYDQQSIVNRFSIERADLKDYQVYGVAIWETYMRLLVNHLSERGEKADRQSMIQEIREYTGYGNTVGTEDLEAITIPELILKLLLIRLQILQDVPRKKCPCLFISHRQSDGLYALRIAQLAKQGGFMFWLDIFDPGLRLLANNTTIPSNLVPLITACIIEMALINCTHVIACMTPATRGTLWMPYEYGRITKIPGFYRRACAWLHPDLIPADFPEYMHLGVIAKNEQEISRWLNSEYMFWSDPDCEQYEDEIEVYDELPEIPGAELEKKKKKFEAWLKAGCPATHTIEALPKIRLKHIPRPRTG